MALGEGWWEIGIKIKGSGGFAARLREVGNCIRGKSDGKFSLALKLILKRLFFVCLTLTYVPKSKFSQLQTFGIFVELCELSQLLLGKIYYSFKLKSYSSWDICY